MRLPVLLERLLGRPVRVPEPLNLSERAEIAQRLREQEAQLRRLDAQIDARRERSE